MDQHGGLTIFLPFMGWGSRGEWRVVCDCWAGLGRAGSVKTRGLPWVCPVFSPNSPPSAVPPVPLGRAICRADASVLGANPAGSLLLGTTFAAPFTEKPKAAGQNHGASFLRGWNHSRGRNDSVFSYFRVVFRPPGKNPASITAFSSPRSRKTTR